MCKKEKPILRFERIEREKEEIKKKPEKQKGKKKKKKWYYKTASRKIITLHGKELPFFFGVCKYFMVIFSFSFMWNVGKM